MTLIGNCVNFGLRAKTAKFDKRGSLTRCYSKGGMISTGESRRNSGFDNFYSSCHQESGHIIQVVFSSFNFQA